MVANRDAATLMARRLTLLQRIRGKQICLLISQRLVQEYLDQLIPIQNDFVKAFLEIMTRPDGHHVVLNWKPTWSGGEQSRARKCRYPAEDDHVLRTAIRDHSTLIYTEEDRMIKADACIYKEFRVHIQEP